MKVISRFLFDACSINLGNGFFDGLLVREAFTVSFYLLLVCLTCLFQGQLFNPKRMLMSILANPYIFSMMFGNVG